jgi:hypothetical protein
MTKKEFDTFTIVRAISKGKPNYFADNQMQTMAEKEYSAFLINKALSFFVDTVLYANEMNQRGHLENRLQHDYLINTVRPMYRQPERWPKPQKDDDIKAVMEYYSCNYNRAKEYVMVLSEDHLSEIHERTKKGGADNGRNVGDGRGTPKKS